MKLRSIALAALFALTASAAAAMPVLKSEVTVTGPIVTVGDMFEDAGSFAETAIFRSPAPGTTGTVSLDAVAQAAILAGLGDYDASNVLRVRVARSASFVDAAVLTGFITEDLRTRGIVHDGIEVDARFDVPDISFSADAVELPVKLLDLRYTPANGAFAARFMIAGTDQPVDVTGRVEFMVEAPHLMGSKPAGTILTSDDVEMRLIPLRQAEGSGAATLDQLVGKQLMRQSRAGMLLRAADVTEPRVVERNAVVTVILHHGPMTLTVKGQALNGAAVGQPVQVLNSVSRKVLFGTAMPNGTVSMTSNSTFTVAGL
jgi:flagella basal body P-ring formation protein FlgA